MEKIKILIVDDHSLVAESVGSFLNTYDQFKVVGYAENGAIALEKLAASKIDVILLDLDMPVMGGHEASKIIVKLFPNVRIIIVSMHEEASIALELFKIGAFGYVPKGCDTEILVHAIEQVYSGNKYVSPQLAKRIESFEEREQIGSKALNNIEKEIICLMAFGKRDKEIVSSLDITINTLKFHKENIRGKTGMETPAQFGAFAVKHKLVDPRDFRLK